MNYKICILEGWVHHALHKSSKSGYKHTKHHKASQYLQWLMLHLNYDKEFKQGWSKEHPFGILHSQDSVDGAQ